MTIPAQAPCTRGMLMRLRRPLPRGVVPPAWRAGTQVAVVEVGPVRHGLRRYRVRVLDRYDRGKLLWVDEEDLVAPLLG